MILECMKCQTVLGSLDNYGSSEEPMCYACASNLSCAVCGSKVTVSEQQIWDGRRLCRACFNEAQKSPVTDPDEPDEDAAADVDEQYVSPFSSTDAVERLFYYESYRMKVTTSKAVTISAILLLFYSSTLLLPFLGGIKDIIASPLSTLDAAHGACLCSYLVYAFLLFRAAMRKVVPGRQGITVTDWLSSRRHLYPEISNALEVGIPEYDHAHRKFAVYKKYLVIVSSAGESRIKEELTKNYRLLKSILEFQPNRKLKYCELKKSGLRKFLERFS